MTSARNDSVEPYSFCLIFCNTQTRGKHVARERTHGHHSVTARNQCHSACRVTPCLQDINKSTTNISPHTCPKRTHKRFHLTPPPPLGLQFSSPPSAAAPPPTGVAPNSQARARVCARAAHLLDLIDVDRVHDVVAVVRELGRVHRLLERPRLQVGKLNFEQPLGSLCRMPDSPGITSFTLTSDIKAPFSPVCLSPLFTLNPDPHVPTKPA